MSNKTDNRYVWQAVIDAHPLESHDPEEWLRYGVALLQTMEPGPDVGKQLQQAALAFVQAQQEGASAEALATAQQCSVLISMRESLMLAGITSKTLEELLVASRISNAPPVVASVANEATSRDSDIAKAITTLVNLYNLELPEDASLKEKFLRAKQQMKQRGLSLGGIRLALNHARLAQKQFSQDAMEVLLTKLT